MIQQTASSVERLESSLSDDYKERMLLEALRDRLQEANGISQYSSTLTDEQEEAVKDLANEVVRFYQTQEPTRLLTDAEKIRESANNSVSNLNQHRTRLDVDNGEEIADVLNEVREASTYIVSNRQKGNGGTIPSSEITSVINEISDLL
jgi:predicted RNA-binding Zn ribbon-like protein